MMGRLTAQRVLKWATFHLKLLSYLTGPCPPSLGLRGSESNKGKGEGIHHVQVWPHFWDLKQFTMNQPTSDHQLESINVRLNSSWFCWPWKVVLLVLWSTKYFTPCSVYLISKPTGRGSCSAMESRGSSHCVVLLLWFTKYTRPLGNIRFSVEGRERGNEKGRRSGG